MYFLVWINAKSTVKEFLVLPENALEIVFGPRRNVFALQ